MNKNLVIHVVAAIVVVDFKVLACRRAPQKVASGQWEFPGGKVDIGENPQEALVREIREELGLECQAGGTFDISETAVDDQVIRLETIFCAITKFQAFKSTDHDAFAWVSAGESQKLTWATPDLPTLNRLIKEKII